MDHHVPGELHHNKVLHLGEVLGERGIKVVRVLIVDDGDELRPVHEEVVVEGVVPVLKFVSFVVTEANLRLGVLNLGLDEVVLDGVSVGS